MKAKKNASNKNKKQNLHKKYLNQAKFKIKGSNNKTGNKWHLTRGLSNAHHLEWLGLIKQRIALDLLIINIVY